MFLCEVKSIISLVQRRISKTGTIWPIGMSWDIITSIPSNHTVIPPWPQNQWNWHIFHFKRKGFGPRSSSFFTQHVGNNLKLNRLIKEMFFFWWKVMWTYKEHVGLISQHSKSLTLDSLHTVRRQSMKPIKSSHISCRRWWMNVTLCTVLYSLSDSLYERLPRKQHQTHLKLNTLPNLPWIQSKSVSHSREPVVLVVPDRKKNKTCGKAKSQ